MTRVLSQTLRHLLLAIGGIFMLAPLVIMLASAFTPTGDILEGRYLARPTLENFSIVAESVPIWHYYLNSILVCLGTFIVQLVVCIPAAYAMARLQFAGRQLGLWLLSMLILVPFQVIAIPIYLMFRAAGLVDSLAALILPFAGSAFAIFLLRQFFLGLPSSMFDAAKLDGANTWAVLTQLVIPSSRPAILSLGIFTVTAAWNAYFWPSFVLTSDASATIPFGVVTFINSEAVTAYGPQMAMATLSVLPLLIAFLFAQRQFMRGLVLNGQAG
ncbi:carbohydrate ABC transporter permease [Leucobacter sp. UT-8R-CII-1-4]|uniref:carbohydrate ABC transporter permease n=1 Tax=Leucobacter sp. UT-8R-CII-1-4 TaxID=3040075 RepID=UPI0024A933C8|nr:carbohydrate ABC transporter permease [Leucobacter sp. UT-8R-CII-1-4]MDI6022857.1 carbohydrate ABC transporter permease [Leucobacter sp. UT-8R-CII-1-4]